MVNIYSLTGELLASAPIASDAVIREELMTADEVRLSWNSESGDELPLGAYIEINEERYSLLEPYCPEWIDAMFYKYEPVFQSRVMAWQRMPIPIYTYEDDMATIKSREFDWEFLGAPEDAMFIIAQAIFNETGERWDYEVAEGLKETVSITAQNTNVFAVLADVAEQCETEWWVDKDNNVLHLSRCERYSELPLEVGVNVSAPSVTNDREDYFTRFYALGSTKNMSNETGSSAVAQIINKRLTLDPKKYPQGYKDIKGHFENGVYVSELRQGEILPTTLVFDDVFPSSNLKISGARPRLKYRVDDAGEIIVKENGQYEYYAIWYFRLNDFQFSTDLILEGKNLSVAFKTGKLAGREFELKYHDRRNVEQYKDDVYAFVVDEGDYEIIIDESEGVILPMVDYVIPEDGDEVVLFNINMPNEYTQSAYLELEKELDKEIEKRLRNNNNYEFESYPAAFRDSALSLEVGRRVVFKYNGVEFHSRVISVEKQLDCEYQQKIRIGNQKISGTRAQMREEIRNVSEEVYAMDKTQRISLSLQRNYAQSLRNTIANYYALKDTIDMLQGAFDGFSEGINPVSVETMLLMLGDNSLQFRIFSDIDSFAPLVNPVVYDDATKHLHVAESGIVHYTLGVNDIQPSSSRDLSGYLRWAMDAYDSGELIEPEAKYYLYARVSKTKQEGEYELTTAKRELSEGGSYNLLVGILNAEYGGSRSFVPLYGYTAITGGQISTDVIRSSDGQTYFDLVNGVIAGDIRFKSTEGGEKSVEEQFSLVDKNVQNLQDQIDGVMENHFYEGTPTTDNYPVSEWTTDDQKINHIGDTYTDIEEFVDSQTTPNAGKSWRWCRCEDVASSVQLSGRSFPTDWYKLGTIDATKNYFGLEYYYNGTYQNTFEIEFDKDIQIVSVPPTYVKIESATGDVYVKDAYGYFSSNVLALVFKGTDYVEVTDKDGMTYRLHWHPIADTDAVKALLKVYELEKKVDDAEYLKETFKKGETNISGGVVMTEMVAVGEGGDNIEAFLNGSDFAEDTENGKLILAGGIPATSKSGSGNLEDRAREARVRMYKDGDFVMKGGGISVERGNVGPFYLGGTHTMAARESYPEIDTKVILQPTSIALVSENFEYNRKINVSIGSEIGSTYGTLRDADGNDLFSISHSNTRGILITTDGSGDENSGVIEIRRNGTGSKCAIEVERGYFAGMRPKVRRVTSTTKTTLDKLDHTILCVRSDGATIPIGLPTEKENGQCYEIWKWGNCGLTLTASNNIARLGQSSSTSQGIGNEWLGIIKLIYSADDAAWLMTLHKTE